MSFVNLKNAIGLPKQDSKQDNISLQGLHSVPQGGHNDHVSNAKTGKFSTLRKEPVDEGSDNGQLKNANFDNIRHNKNTYDQIMCIYGKLREAGNQFDKNQKNKNYIISKFIVELKFEEFVLSVQKLESSPKQEQLACPERRRSEESASINLDSKILDLVHFLLKSSNDKTYLQSQSLEKYRFKKLALFLSAYYIFESFLKSDSYNKSIKFKINNYPKLLRVQKKTNFDSDQFDKSIWEILAIYTGDFRTKIKYLNKNGIPDTTLVFLRFIELVNKILDENPDNIKKIYEICNSKGEDLNGTYKEYFHSVKSNKGFTTPSLGVSSVMSFIPKEDTTLCKTLCNKLNLFNYKLEGACEICNQRTKYLYIKFSSFNFLKFSCRCATHCKDDYKENNCTLKIRIYSQNTQYISQLKIYHESRDAIIEKLKSIVKCDQFVKFVTNNNFFDRNLYLIFKICKIYLSDSLKSQFYNLHLSYLRSEIDSILQMPDILESVKLNTNLQEWTKYSIIYYIFVFFIYCFKQFNKKHNPSNKNLQELILSLEKTSTDLLKICNIIKTSCTFGEISEGSKNITFEFTCLLIKACKEIDGYDNIIDRIPVENSIFKYLDVKIKDMLDIINLISIDEMKRTCSNTILNQKEAIYNLNGKNINRLVDKLFEVQLILVIIYILELSDELNGEVSRSQEETRVLERRRSEEQTTTFPDLREGLNDQSYLYSSINPASFDNLSIGNCSIDTRNSVFSVPSSINTDSNNPESISGFSMPSSIYTDSNNPDSISGLSIPSSIFQPTSNQHRSNSDKRVKFFGS